MLLAIFISPYIGSRFTFVKELNKSCDSIYKNYNSLRDAKGSCRVDEGCRAVVDWKCNDQGVHSLCRKISNSSKLVESCRYRKGIYTY